MVSIILLVVAALMVGLDQLLKYLVVVNLKPIGTAPFIPGILGLRYVENDGAAFSILAGQQTFLIIVTSIALLVWAYFLFFKRPQSKMEVAGMVMVLAGGVGNLIDRVANGFVVDYLDVLFMQFAVFNLADTFVCVGFAVLIIGVVRSELKGRKKAEVNTEVSKDAKPEQVDGNH
ncbi:signal peptidase II [Ruminococcaceae bacterium OttesenSCG-928-A16]|nr:signal peptidase II [Ruminococcaceae bacterium OttesenSCG-928-A16]